MKLVAPSILSADFSRLKEEITAVERSGADWIHVDVMDGRFVPNITVGPFVVEAIRKITKLPIDVHLMIENPWKYAEDFVKAGADYVSVHIEGHHHIDRTIGRIRELGARPSVALNPGTHVSSVSGIFDIVDMVLLMTVNPGFGGQKFIPYCKKKIMELRKLIDDSGRKILLEVDGGIKADNIGELSRLGADVFVAGSAVFESPDYNKTILAMKREIS